jgi:hypothetical protein
MSKRILVGEDQEDNRQIIRDLLSATDYEITETESGEQALDAVAKQRPDLILMDIQLPGIRRLRDDAADQSRSGVAVDPDHRGYFHPRWDNLENTHWDSMGHSAKAGHAKSLETGSCSAPPLGTT